MLFMKFLSCLENTVNVGPPTFCAWEVLEDIKLKYSLFFSTWKPGELLKKSIVFQVVGAEKSH